MIQEMKLCPGVTLRALQTNQFKTGCFSVSFLRPHTPRDAALDALLPSVLLRGTEKHPHFQDISAYLDQLYGATVGTLVRLRGEVKFTGFYADFIEDAFLPRGEEVCAPMVAFLEELLYHPHLVDGCFPSDAVEGEKQNLVNAIESALNDKRSYASRQMRQAMFPEEPYRIPRLGYAEDVETITPRELYEHYEEVLASSSIEIFYAGRLSPARAAELFRPVFAGRPRQKPVEVRTLHVPASGTVREVSEEMEVTQGNLVIGLRTSVTCSSPLYPALLLLNAVYGAGITSKLFVNVREKRSLCYYAGSGIDKFKGVMMVTSGIAPERYEEARDAILEELEACRRGEISRDELESARRQVLSGLRAALESPVRLDEYYLGRAADPAIADIETLMEEIQALDVPELIRAAETITTDTIYFLKGVTP